LKLGGVPGTGACVRGERQGRRRRTSLGIHASPCDEPSVNDPGLERRHTPCSLINCWYDVDKGVEQELGPLLLRRGYKNLISVFAHVHDPQMLGSHVSALVRDLCGQPVSVSLADSLLECRRGAAICAGAVPRTAILE
jgi:hypothetical protein